MTQNEQESTNRRNRMESYGVEGCGSRADWCTGALAMSPGAYVSTHRSIEGALAGQRSWNDGPRDLLRSFRFFLKAFWSREFDMARALSLLCRTHATDSPGGAKVMHNHAGGHHRCRPWFLGRRHSILVRSRTLDQR